MVGIMPAMTRPGILLPILFSLLLPVMQVSAQEQTADSADGQHQAEYAPRSGNAWIDRHLVDINHYAARYPDSFLDELARYHAVPRAYADALLRQPEWTPADVYMACALAQVSARPCRAVVREWARDHEGGWEAVAERLEAGPGSEPYRRLRKGITDSYQRWARPTLR